MSYMAHLHRLHGVVVEKFAYDSFLSGDLWVEFVYRGERFSVSNDYDGDLFLETSISTQQYVFDEVLHHLKNYQKVGFFPWLAALWRYKLARPVSLSWKRPR
jgi:hypothetical protein